MYSHASFFRQLFPISRSLAKSLDVDKLHRVVHGSTSRRMGKTGDHGDPIALTFSTKECHFPTLYA